jgi:hypothetical protein
MEVFALHPALVAIASALVNFKAQLVVLVYLMLASRHLA